MNTFSNTLLHKHFEVSRGARDLLFEPCCLVHGLLIICGFTKAPVVTVHGVMHPQGFLPPWHHGTVQQLFSEMCV
jgi:hypothetical protein